MSFTRIQVLIDSLILSVLVSSVWIYNEKKKQRRAAIQQIIIDARSGLSLAQYQELYSSIAIDFPTD